MKLREPDEIDRRWLEQRLSVPRPDRLANRTTRGRLAVRALILDVLSSTEAPVRVRELVAVLSAHGLETTAPASQLVSNLLRAERAAGRVERTARGVYRWIAETGPV